MKTNPLTKVLSILLSLVMAFSAFGAAAFAEPEEFTPSGENYTVLPKADGDELSEGDYWFDVEGLCALLVDMDIITDEESADYRAATYELDESARYMTVTLNGTPFEVDRYHEGEGLDRAYFLFLTQHGEETWTLLPHDPEAVNEGDLYVDTEELASQYEGETAELIRGASFLVRPTTWTDPDTGEVYSYVDGFTIAPDGSYDTLIRPQYSLKPAGFNKLPTDVYDMGPDDAYYFDRFTFAYDFEGNDYQFYGAGTYYVNSDASVIATIGLPDEDSQMPEVRFAQAGDTVNGSVVFDYLLTNPFTEDHIIPTSADGLSVGDYYFDLDSALQSYYNEITYYTSDAYVEEQKAMYQEMWGDDYDEEQVMEIITDDVTRACESAQAQIDILEEEGRVFYLVDTTVYTLVDGRFTSVGEPTVAGGTEVSPLDNDPDFLPVRFDIDGIGDYETSYYLPFNDVIDLLADAMRVPENEKPYLSSEMSGLHLHKGITALTDENGQPVTDPETGDPVTVPAVGIWSSALGEPLILTEETLGGLTLADLKAQRTALLAQYDAEEDEQARAELGAQLEEMVETYLFVGLYELVLNNVVTVAVLPIEGSVDGSVAVPLEALPALEEGADVQVTAQTIEYTAGDPNPAFVPENVMFDDSTSLADADYVAYDLNMSVDGEPIPALDAPVTVKLMIPNGCTDPFALKVFSFNEDGEAEQLETYVTDLYFYIQFRTDHFGACVIAEKRPCTHKNAVRLSTSPTCQGEFWLDISDASEEAAYLTFRYCPDCGAYQYGEGDNPVFWETISEETLLAVGIVKTPSAHSFDDTIAANVTVVDATCLAAGFKTVKCATCDETVTTDTYPALGHNFDDTIAANVETVEATCTAPGSRVVKCSRCQETQTTETGPALGHNFDDTIAANVQVVVAATCTAAGTSTVRCIRCDETKTIAVPALGHNFDDTIAENVEIVEATCLEAGSRSVRCSRCDETETTDTYPALGHNFDDTIAGNVTTVEPTCAADGYKSVKCSRCSETKTIETYPAVDHVFDESIITNVHTADPTCTAAGSKTVKCKFCNQTQTTETGPALGHDFDDTIAANVTTVEATCTAAAAKIVRCSRCEETQTTETGPALGHDFDATIAANVETVEATCTAPGSRIVKCSRCQETQTTETDPMLGHDFNDAIAGSVHVVVAATCTAAGTNTVKCSRCDETKTVAVPALGHTFDDTIPANVTVTAATCLAAGSRAVKCSRCDETQTTETDPALGHNFDETIADNVQVVVAATCTTAGSNAVRCSRCDETETVEVQALGHNFDDTIASNVTVKAATCLAAGSRAVRCSRCDETQTTETDPAMGHDFDDSIADNVHVVVAVTCDGNGFNDIRCSRCDETKTVTVQALGHDFDDTIADNVTTVNATCTAAGSRVVKCSRCDETVSSETDPALGHNFDDTIAANVTTVEATCTIAGSRVVKCSRCDETVSVETDPALGHNFDDTVAENVTNVAATCTAAGSRIVKCSRCDETQTSESGNALGHDFDDSIEANVAIVAPTCTTYGSKTVKCNRCNNKKMSSIAPTGHQYGDWTVTKEATETESGEKTRECSVCHDTQTEEIPASGNGGNENNNDNTGENNNNTGENNNNTGENNNGNTGENKTDDGGNSNSQYRPQTFLGRLRLFIRTITEFFKRIFRR